MNHKIIPFLFILICILPVGYSNQKTSQNDTNANSNRSISWIQDLQANSNDPNWFYQHLNSSDRLKIREALDYAIPRDDIITNAYQGHAQTFLSPILPQFGVPILNQTARAYNITKALSLLTEVFGYKYGQDNLTTPYLESQPYFSIQIIVPTNNQQRVIWANRISSEWNNIGIDTSVLDLSLNDALTRIFSPANLGWDFNTGGFDAFFIGLFDSSLSDIYGMFNSHSISPQNNNYYFLNDTTIDEITDTIQNNPNMTIRNQAILNFQKWYYDNIPASVINQRILPYALNENLKGFNPFTICNFENWTYAGKNQVIISQPTGLVDLNPVYYNYLNIYDKYITNPTYRGMFIKSTESGDNTFLKWHVYPYFADWWNSSADGLTWFVNLKTGLKWSDGIGLTTNDVKFTFDMILDPNIGSDYYQVLQPLLENDSSINVINGTLIKFQFKNFSPEIMNNIFTLPIIPEHVLMSVTPSDWRNDTTNSNGIGVYNGPYTLVNATNSSAYLQKNPIYDQAYVTKLNTSTKLATNKSGIPSLAVPTINYIIIKSLNNQTQALNLLKEGQIDFIDAQTDLISLYNNITAPAQVVNFFENGWQEVGYNQASPIWGINPMDPNKMYPNGYSSNVYTTHGQTTTYISSTRSTYNNSFNSILILFLLAVLLIIGSIFINNKISKQRNANNKFYNKYQNIDRQKSNGPFETNKINNSIGKRCKNCFQPVDIGDIFCQNCGERL